MHKKASCRNTGIHHVGLCVKDFAASAAFYRDVMCMEIVGGSSETEPILGAAVFLGSRPDEESHEIALFTKPEFAHIALKVASLSELKAFYQRICAQRLPVKNDSQSWRVFCLLFRRPGWKHD